MIALPSAPVQTIRRTLAIGFSILIVLLITAGGVGWVSMAGLSRDVVETFSHANEVTQQASVFSHVITREVQAAGTYLSDGDPSAEADFRRLGIEAHDLHRTFTAQRSDLAGEIANTVAVDSRLAEVENAYAIAHRLSDIGRTEEARLEARKG